MLSARRTRPLDLVHAYMWSLVASKRASQARGLMTRMLTPKQIDEAEQEARWSRLPSLKGTSPAQRRKWPNQSSQRGVRTQICRPLHSGSRHRPEPTITLGQTLAKVPIFSGLTENRLSFLAQHAVPRNYQRGRAYLVKADLSGLYVVESGHVRIFRVPSMDANRYSVLMVRAVQSPNFLSSMVEAIPRL